MTEFMPVRPYFVENEGEDELQAKAKELQRKLDLQNPPDPPLSWVERTRLEQDLKTVKRLLAGVESRRQHEQAQLRRPVVAEQTTCGLRRAFVVPAHIESARCEAEKQFISNAIPRHFMPVKPPSR